jgi:hypothetical protein
MWLGESWRGFSRTQRLRRRDLDWEDRGPYGELERDETDQLLSSIAESSFVESR